MAKKKYYWKVCRIKRGEFFSVVMYRFPSISVEYRENKWVKPKIGKLTVFSSLEKAERFKSFMIPVNANDLVIKKCEAQNIIKPAKERCNDFDLKSIKKYWKDILSGKPPSVSTWLWPQGTRLADAVKILPD